MCLHIQTCCGVLPRVIFRVINTLMWYYLIISFLLFYLFCIYLFFASLPTYSRQHFWAWICLWWQIILSRLYKTIIIIIYLIDITNKCLHIFSMFFLLLLLLIIIILLFWLKFSTFTPNFIIALMLNHHSIYLFVCLFYFMNMSMTPNNDVYLGYIKLFIFFKLIFHIYFIIITHTFLTEMF